MGAYFVFKMIVCSQIPFSVPSCVQNGLFHIFYGFLGKVSFVFHALMTADCGIVLSVQDKHPGNKYGLRIRPFGRSGRLERFSRFRGKTVQVQAVVPVCPPDQRQTVRPQVIHRVVEGAA